MELPHNIPAGPGVYAIVDLRKRRAYVGVVRNLYARAHNLEHQFKRYWEEPKFAQMPIKGFETTKPEHLKFIYSQKVTDDQLRDRLRRKGVKTVNDSSRVRVMDYEVEGVRATVVDHAKRIGIGHRTVYRRLASDWTIRQALGLDPVPLAKTIRQERA